MSNVTLVRVVKPVLVMNHGSACIENRAKTVCVKLEDDKGNKISIAFDGRCDCEAYGSSSVLETYERYTDCPVILNGQQSGPVTDLQAMRLLRDGLIAMDLG